MEDLQILVRTEFKPNCNSLEILKKCLEYLLPSSFSKSMQHFKRQTFNWVTSSSNLGSQFIWHFLLEALEKKQGKKDQQRKNVGYQLSVLSQEEKGRKWYLLHNNIEGSQMQLHSQLALTWDHRMPQGQLQTFPVHPTLLSSPAHYSKAMHLRYQVFWWTLLSTYGIFTESSIF